jgi:hypothetical protein
MRLGVNAGEKTIKCPACETRQPNREYNRYCGKETNEDESVFLWGRLRA